MAAVQWKPFRTFVSGKWIIAGEHSVLRGSTAVALPYPLGSLCLSFETTEEEFFKVEPLDSANIVREILKYFSLPEPNGKLEIQSTIQVGAGLGSAALCLALTRWVATQLNLDEDRIIQFATQFEYRFHGKSSGIDVATISAGRPILFCMNKERNHPFRSILPLEIKRLPCFTFHDTGIRACTADCVKHVEGLMIKNAQQGEEIDRWMDEASQWALKGLIQYDRGEVEEGIDWIQKSMKQAHKCFHSWGLVPPEVKDLEERLLKGGALAVKLTGAFLCHRRKAALGAAG